MERGTQFWTRISLLNLLIVAALGLLMRYKIGFDFPYLEQKHLQFAHYHFAFYGWITQTLMVLMVHSLRQASTAIDQGRYNWIFTCNMIGSYGMLAAFMVNGYGVAALACAAVSIVAAAWFTIVFLGDLGRARKGSVASKWFRAALWFNLLSTLGTFALAYMMLTKDIRQNEYLASVYFFLHFQYNGWFFFACMGLFMDFIRARAKAYSTAFRLFLFCCVPTYFLSVLWLDLPTWLYGIVVLAAFAQLYGWVLVGRQVIKDGIDPSNSGVRYVLRYILVFAGVALTIKLLLQAGSTIPAVSKLAFGFRPVVIAYLHLVLLAVITLFLLFYIFAADVLPATRKIILGLLLFSSAVFVNELILAVQGIAAFSYTPVPYVNGLLLFAAVLLVAGIAAIWVHSLRKPQNK